MPDPLIHAPKLTLKICTEWKLCYSTMRSFFETPQGYWPILFVLKNCAHWAITKHYLSHIKTLRSTVDDGVKFLNRLFSQTILLLKQITHPVELCVCQPHHLFISLLNIIHVLSYGCMFRLKKNMYYANMQLSQYMPTNRAACRISDHGNPNTLLVLKWLKGGHMHLNL